jgi:hypothetical protein
MENESVIKIKYIEYAESTSAGAFTTQRLSVSTAVTY